jgi:integrase
MANKIRGKNEGSIFQRPNGSWRGQISLGGKRLCFSSKTRKEVQDWLKKTIAQVDDGLTYHGANTTLKDFLEGWLVSIQETIRSGTFNQYEMTCRRHIFPFLGNLMFKDVTPMRIQELYISKSKAGTGARTIQVIHTVLHKSFEHAVKLGMIGRNPTDAANPPRYLPEEMKFYDETQVSRLLMAARGDRYEVLYHLAIVTGLRQSELLGLKWSDLNWQKRTLKVQRQLKRNHHDQGYFTTPKTKAGKRSIDLGVETIRKLHCQYDRQRLERLEAGNRWEENDLIFPSIIGTPLDQYNLLKRFKRFIQSVGLPEIRFHDLRHTAASLMLNHGIPAIVVARRLGHSKVSITLDTYGHLLPEIQSAAADLMDDLISPVEVDLHQTAPQLHQDQVDSPKDTRITPHI